MKVSQSVASLAGVMRDGVEVCPVSSITEDVHHAVRVLLR